jgi:hypothetical protein
MVPTSMALGELKYVMKCGLAIHIVSKVPGAKYGQVIEPTL